MTSPKTESVTVETLTARFLNSDLGVVYDVFSDAVSSLQGAYMKAERAAGSLAEEKLWLDRAIALRNYRDAISSDDREAVYKAIVVVQAERLQVTERNRTNAA